MKACQAAFKELSSGPAVESIRGGQTSPSSGSGPAIPRKRAAPTSADSPATAARAIKPRPAAFAGLNGSQDAMAHNKAAETSGQPPKKKRGRPSKADLEQRMAEAAARGEPYRPSPKTTAHRKPKAERIMTATSARTSAVGGAPMAMMVSPSEGYGESAATPKKRGRPSKSVMEAKQRELEDTGAAAGGAMESGQEVIKETQQSEFAAPESLLIAMHERALLSEGDRDIHMRESDTLESSGTLPAYSGRTKE